MIYTVFEKNIENIKIYIVCNNNTCIALVMMSTLCCDNIVIMSRFVELWHYIIENQWNPCFDFLRTAMTITHLSVVYSIPTTGAIRVCPNVPRTAAMFALSLALLWGPPASLFPFLSVLCWSNVSTLYLIPSVF